MKFLKNRSRGNKIFWVVILIVFFLMVFDVARGQYEVWKGQQAVEALRLELEKTEMEKQQRMAADTAGGSTPQETLQMFIDAVEAGDYELASKYFVIEKQEEELESLQNAPRENIENVMGLFKTTDYSSGGYSQDNTRFIVHSPLRVIFTLYPSGNWKIEEI